MTTIAYHHNSKTLAIDSRRTGDESIIADNEKKFFQHTDGSWWFTCGRVTDLPLLIEAYNNKKIEETRMIYANAFVVKNGSVYRIGVEEQAYWEELVTFNHAMGSGWQWAMAAMDFHYTAEAAVEYAKTRDYHTGGKVHVYNVKAGEFI